MSGLVTRLQKQAERGTYIPDGPKLILEAIAELESLRRELAEAQAVLVKIRDHAESTAPEQISYWARAALADQPGEAGK